MFPQLWDAGKQNIPQPLSVSQLCFWFHLGLSEYETLIHCGFIVNIFFSLVIPKAQSCPSGVWCYHLYIFTQNALFLMLVPWLYPVLFCILFSCSSLISSQCLHINDFLLIFKVFWFFFFCAFLWSSLHLFLKFVIYFYYLCLLNIHYLPGICNSVFIVYKLTNDTFLSNYVTSP